MTQRVKQINKEILNPKFHCKFIYDYIHLNKTKKNSNFVISIISQSKSMFKTNIKSDT